MSGYEVSRLQQWLSCIVLVTRIIHSRWCCNLYITSHGFYCSWICNCITTTTILWPLFPDHLGEPVPKENFWTLWCKEGLTEADTLTIRMGATPSVLISDPPPSSPIFMPDALPAATPQFILSWDRQQICRPAYPLLVSWKLLSYYCLFVV